MTSASVMRRKPARERTARTCAAVLTAFLLATLTVGCGWLGGPSRITDNRRILNSLPMPAGVGQISIDSHYHTQGHSLLAPPDGWATLATCQTPPELSREGIVDFYRSRLSPEWISCVETDSVFTPATGERTEEMGNARFWRGSTCVSIDTYGHRQTAGTLSTSTLTAITTGLPPALRSGLVEGC